MPRFVRLLPIALAVLALAACNMPGSQAAPGPSVNEQAATIVAATMSAATLQASQQTPIVSTIPPLATEGGKPSLFINTDNAACRGGPGPDFKVIASYPAGTSLDMVGKDRADNYWIVVDPISHDQCWVSIQDATPTGNFQGLPEIKPPTPSAGVPPQPAKGAWNYACDNTTLTTVLGWTAPSGPVNGYRLYRDDNQIADVPATQTTYTEKIPFKYGSSISYAVAAYNDAGVSAKTTWNFHCP